MKRKIEYIAVVVMVIILFIIPGCSGDIIQPTPPDPEIFADISGYDSVHFETVVMATKNIYSYQLIISGTSAISGKQYGLLISIFYLDTNLTTGTFKFRSDKISGQEYAVGSFTIDNGKDEKVFMSDSGTVIITELNFPIIKGTYNFFASDTSNTEHISVQNGILNSK